MNSGRAFIAVAVLAVVVQGTEAGPRAGDTQYILFNRAPGQGMYQGVPDSLGPKSFDEVRARFPNRSDSRCRYVCIFNWESIHTSDSIRNAIADMVESGASTARSQTNSRESTPP